MSKKRNWNWILLPIVATAIVAWYYLGSGYGTKQAQLAKQGIVHVDCVPFEIHGGWGYDIVAKEKTFIHQDRIPAISGDKPFATKEDALKVGRLMLDKLKAGKFPPAVTYQEMKNIGITMN